MTIAPRNKVIDTRNNTISANNKIIAIRIKKITARSKVISAHYKIIDTCIKIIATHNKIIDTHNKTINTTGRAIDTAGNANPELACPTDRRGNAIARLVNTERDEIPFYSLIQRLQWVCTHESNPGDSEILVSQLHSFKRFLERNYEVDKHVTKWLSVLCIMPPSFYSYPCSSIQQSYALPLLRIFYARGN